MLWVLKRIISMRLFFLTHKKNLLIREQSQVYLSTQNYPIKIQNENYRNDNLMCDRMANRTDFETAQTDLSLNFLITLISLNINYLHAD